MARYIDADKLWKDTTTYFDYCEEYLELIEKQPTADVVPMDFHNKVLEMEIKKQENLVEVVRCKDCKYADFDQYDKTEEFDVFCFHFSMGFMRRCDFCSWGERREDGEIH